MMGVYIKSMEMPTNCCQCLVNMEVCKRGYKYFLEHPELYDKRADDCPLVPVQPHGDLIDRGELLKCKQHYEYLSDEYYITVRDIEEAPTIIPAEEGE